MDVETFFEDGLLFEVAYYHRDTQLCMSKFMFPIHYTEEMVSEFLSNQPHCLKISHVMELAYILKPKSCNN